MQKIKILLISLIVLVAANTTYAANDIIRYSQYTEDWTLREQLFDLTDTLSTSGAYMSENFMVSTGSLTTCGAGSAFGSEYKENFEGLGRIELTNNNNPNKYTTWKFKPGKDFELIPNNHEAIFCYNNGPIDDNSPRIRIKKMAKPLILRSIGSSGYKKIFMAKKIGDHETEFELSFRCEPDNMFTDYDTGENSEKINFIFRKFNLKTNNNDFFVKVESKPDGEVVDTNDTDIVISGNRANLNFYYNESTALSSSEGTLMDFADNDAQVADRIKSNPDDLELTLYNGKIDDIENVYKYDILAKANGKSLSTSLDFISSTGYYLTLVTHIKHSTSSPTVKVFHIMKDGLELVLGTAQTEIFLGDNAIITGSLLLNGESVSIDSQSITWHSSDSGILNISNTTGESKISATAVGVGNATIFADYSYDGGRKITSNILSFRVSSRPVTFVRTDVKPEQAAPGTQVDFETLLNTEQTEGDVAYIEIEFEDDRFETFRMYRVNTNISTEDGNNRAVEDHNYNTDQSDNDLIEQTFRGSYILPSDETLSGTGYLFTTTAVMKNGARITASANDGPNSIFITTIGTGSEITVLSNESYAVPEKIVNNNEMTTTLWTVVDGIGGVNNINRVTVDLRPLGGSAVKQMNKSTVVDDKVWFKLDDVTALQTTPTGTNAILLTITAEDTRGLKAYGTVRLTITNNLMSSSPPVVSDISTVYTKKDKLIDLYATVTDMDGLTDIQTVIANLSSIGLGYQVLHSIDTITPQTNVSTSRITNLGANIFDSRSERTSTVYRLPSPLEVPQDKSSGYYNIIVTAYDNTGEQGSEEYKYKYSGGTPPEFVRKYERSQYDSDDLNSFVHLTKYKIPNDGESTFDVSVIVKDDDGINDVIEVRADLTSIGGGVVFLQREGVQSGVDYSAVKTGVYKLSDILVPAGTIEGWREFKIIAYDKQGNETAIRVEIKVLGAQEAQDELNENDRLHIDTVKSYSTPSVIDINNEDPFSIKVFVRNNGFKVDYVVAHFGNLIEHTGTKNLSQGGSCLNQNESIVCMHPSVIEGKKGQWFTLDGLVLKDTTKPALDGYKIKISAIEEGGSGVEANFPLIVSDGTLPEDQNGYPKFQMAISTAEDHVQLVFSRPLDSRKVEKHGFKIVEYQNTRKALNLHRLSFNSDGNIVDIMTSDQEPGMKYTVIVDAEVIGLKEDSYLENHKAFYGFDKSLIPPQLHKITPMSQTKLALYFDQGIMPSSVELKGGNFDIFEKNNPEETIKVLHTAFSSDSNKVLYISTAKQKRNEEYILRARNLQSASGIPLGGNKRRISKYVQGKYFGITKHYIGYYGVPDIDKRSTDLFMLSNPTLDNCVDFRDFTVFTENYKRGVPLDKYFDYDYNNKVDFRDFTAFSSQYGVCMNDIEDSTPEIKTGYSPDYKYGTGDIIGGYDQIFGDDLGDLDDIGGSLDDLGDGEKVVDEQFEEGEIIEIPNPN